LILGLVSPVKISAQQSESSDEIGVTAYGLRGVNRVGVPVSPAPSLMISGSMGYGYTESIGSVEGSHHRLHGILGGGVSVFPWLAFGLNLDGRYDVHPRDEKGDDSSIVGEPRLVARGGYQLNEQFQIGIELGLLFPGTAAPSIVFDATTLDTKLLFAYTRSDINLTVAGLVGFRLDNSGQSAPPLDRTRPGDRLSLQASDFNEALVGVGASYRISPAEIIVELTGDILVGKGAPDFLTSPIRIAVGARYHLLSSLSVELLTETVVSARPGDKFANALVPIEPRFSALAGLRYALDFSETKPIEKKPVEKKTAQKPLVKVEEKPKKATITGALVDENNGPVVSAHVRMEVGDQNLETNTDEQGVYRFDNVRLGEGSIHAQADGFEDSDWSVQVVPDMPAQQPRQLTRVVQETPQTPVGQLRGLIRSFNGKPLSATITVDPIEKTLSTDATGQFEIDLPTGSYEVSIQSSGYQTQHRRVTVEVNGVSIINADLHKKRGTRDAD
jgi:hypothetical protein